MGEKNSFILYNDQIEIFKKLTIEQQSTLILKIFEYANSYNSNSIDDPIVDMAFTPIKTAMDRDRKRYDIVCKGRSASGKKGGLKKAENIASRSKLSNW